MRLVNHASELIHQIYQREKVDDHQCSRPRHWPCFPSGNCQAHHAGHFADLQSETEIGGAKASPVSCRFKCRAARAYTSRVCAAARC